MSDTTNIQQKIDKLAELTSWFESEGFDFEQAPARFKEAAQLAETIEKELDELKNKITVVKQKFDTDK